MLRLWTLTPTFPSNTFWLKINFIPTLTMPNSFTCMSLAIRVWLECWKNVKVGSGHVCVVLGAHVRVSTLINGCSSNANFAWTLMMFMLVEKEIFLDVHVKPTFVLTSTIRFSICTLSDFREYFAWDMGKFDSFCKQLKTCLFKCHPSIEDPKRELGGISWVRYWNNNKINK